ncbi:MAG: hypothetical protein GXO71_01225 [Caldiserica bacterium]|nr:hypothetical protein [Caldisericota bacterium]
MKAILCYYSGSGNTKLACEYMAKNIKNIQIDLFNIVKTAPPDLEKYEVVGFATFANFLAPPYLMRSFLENLPRQDDKPAFVFNTYGLLSGKTLKILDKWATAKGFKVIAGHSLHTPENYPPMIVSGKGNEQAPNEKEMADFENFISELDQLFSRIKEGSRVERKRVRISLLNTLLPAFPPAKARKDMGEKYVDKKLCTECGICEGVCPYGAIKLNPKPIFDLNKCYGCWACYNHCPSRAIYTKKYKGAGHYPQPIEQLKKKLEI